MAKKSYQKELSIMLFVVFGLLAFWSFVTQDTQWGLIYSNVFYVSLALIILSFVLPKFFEYQPISDRHFVTQVVIGFGFGVVLIGGLVFGSQLSFLSPLSIPNVSGILGILGFSAISLVFVMSIVVSEFEETLRSGTLRVTIAEWLGNERTITPILLMVGLIIYFLIEPLKVLGLGFILLGGINFVNRGFLSNYLESKWTRYFLSILVVGAFFSLLHLTAYANPGDPSATSALMLNAFIYAVIADFINTYFESTVPSRVAHTLNNAAVSSVAVGVPVMFAFVVAGFHSLLMYAIARS